MDIVISTSTDKKNVLQSKYSSCTTGRETSALPGQLQKTNKREEYFANDQGISNFFPPQTKAKQGTKENKLSDTREGNNVIRSGEFLEVVWSKTTLPIERQISE